MQSLFWRHNFIGYSEQYYTIVNGTIKDTAIWKWRFPDWDNSSLRDQVSYFNEKKFAYTWDKSNPRLVISPGRLDFIFTNSVML